jgi:hypothetical protein
MYLSHDQRAVGEKQLDLIEFAAKSNGEKLSPQERFRKFIKPQRNGCWHFIGAIDPSSIGYGRFSVDNEKWLAHRWSFLDAGGVLTEEKPLVLHQCNNPCCVRPAHLYAGDNADNRRDKMEAKRQRGTLKRDQVIMIVAFHAKGRTVDQLAKQFKISAISIRNVLCGRTHGKTTGIQYQPHKPHSRKIRKAA